MTRKEWIREHYPEEINEKFLGGVWGCPESYPSLCRIDQSIREVPPCMQQNKALLVTCKQCWNQEMEVAQ